MFGVTYSTSNHAEHDEVDEMQPHIMPEALSLTWLANTSISYGS